MKRKIFSLLIGCIALSLNAQPYSVSTEQQPKHVLLEEFTGINCGYCPDGHQIAHRLKEALADDISVVAIHCGGYAPSYNDEEDFTVEDGKAIGQFLGATKSGFPNGSVNRRVWVNEVKYTYNRGYWEDLAKKVAQEKAPVNLWAKAEIDASTRQMKIRIEGYYFNELSDKNLSLHLLLTQSNILGRQAGTTSGRNYHHQHVLRDAITDVYGDPLPHGKKGEYFVKEYTYQVPESYKKLAVDPTQLELVAFVSEGHFNVLNVINVKPNYLGETLPLKATIREDKLKISGGYRYDFVDLVLENQCNTPLRKASFDIVFNGVTSKVDWEGEIPPFMSQQIRIPVDWRNKAVDHNAYSIVLMAFNGKAIPTTNISGLFSAPSVIPHEFALRIHTDSYASENTYRLYSMDGTCLKSFGPFSDWQQHHYEEILSLEPNEQYCLEVTDRWGNGIFYSGNPIEFVTTTGDLLMAERSIEGFGKRIFFQTSVPSGVEAQPLVGEKEYKIYDIWGRLVKKSSRLEALPHGLFIVRSNNEVKKVLVH